MALHHFRRRSARQRDPARKGALIAIGEVSMPVCKRYGDKTLEESAARADELVAAGELHVQGQ